MLPQRRPVHGVMVSSNCSHIDLKGGGRQPSLQPLLQKGQHDSDWALPGVFSVRRAPLDEQVPLQGVSMSRRRRSPKWWCQLPLGVGHLEPPRPGPGTRHEVSRGLDKGAIRCPVSEVSRSFLRGICQGGAVTRSISSGNQVRVGQYWRHEQDLLLVTPWSYTVVCARRLTGGERILAKAPRPTVCQCICTECSSVSEKKNWQWEVSRDANRSTWAGPETSPNQLGPSGDGVSTLRGAQLVTARRLPGWAKPGMWMARSNLRCFWLQRRRVAGELRHATGAIDHLVGWCTQRSQCCPCGPVRARLVDGSWGGSRPGVLSATLGNWCASAVGARPNPRHCKPIERGTPASGGGIRVNHSMPGDLFRGTPARRNERSDYGVLLHLRVARLRASCSYACHQVWRGPGRAVRLPCDRLYGAALLEAAAFAARERGWRQGAALGDE